MTRYRSDRVDRAARISRRGSTAPRATPTLAIGLALLALGGCATPRAGVPFGDSDPAAYEPGDLAGEWRGSFNEIEAVLYEDEANLLLQIKPDGTFVERVTPGSGTNNLAKPATWTGVVEERGGRVILKSSRGWWLTLDRSGDQLYGVTREPLSEQPIAIRFRRESPHGYAATPGFAAVPEGALVR